MAILLYTAHEAPLAELLFTFLSRPGWFEYSLCFAQIRQLFVLMPKADRFAGEQGDPVGGRFEMRHALDIGAQNIRLELHKNIVGSCSAVTSEIKGAGKRHGFVNQIDKLANLKAHPSIAARIIWAFVAPSVRPEITPFLLTPGSVVRSP